MGSDHPGGPGGRARGQGMGRTKAQRDTRRSTQAARRSDRALVLVDLENVVGDPWATGPEVVEAYESVLVAAGHRGGDLVVVAANRWMLAELGTRAHTSAQLLVGHGPDGADLALLDWVASWPAVFERCGRVVVASGDGIFATVAAEANLSGVAVSVVSRPASLSRRLRDLPVDLVGI